MDVGDCEFGVVWYDWFVVVGGYVEYDVVCDDWWYFFDVEFFYVVDGYEIGCVVVVVVYVVDVDVVDVVELCVDVGLCVDEFVVECEFVWIEVFVGLLVDLYVV